MAGIDFERQPFLRPEQADLLSRGMRHYDELAAGLLEPGNQIRQLRAVYSGYIGYAKQRMGEHQAAEKDFQGQPIDLSGLEARLQQNAMAEVETSHIYQAAGNFIASLTGYHSALGGEDSMQALHGYEAGAQAVKLVAQKEVGGLLIASYLLTTAWDFDEGSSVWQRAVLTHQHNRRIRPPVTIDEIEADQHSQLFAQAGAAYAQAAPIPALKPSKFKPVLAGRLLMRGYKMMRETGMAVDNPYDLEVISKTVGLIPRIWTPDFNEEQLLAGERATERMRRYVVSAARADKSIAEDPRVRYLLFLRQQFRHANVKDGRKKFAGDVAAATRTFRRNLVRPFTEAPTPFNSPATDTLPELP